MSTENAGTVDLILNKKAEGYSFEKNDFVAPSEITVTITLGRIPLSDHKGCNCR